MNPRINATHFLTFLLRFHLTWCQLCSRSFPWSFWKQNLQHGSADVYPCWPPQKNKKQNNLFIWNSCWLKRQSKTLWINVINLVLLWHDMILCSHDFVIFLTNICFCITNMQKSSFLKELPTSALINDTIWNGLFLFYFGLPLSDRTLYLNFFYLKLWISASTEPNGRTESHWREHLTE